MFGIADLIVVAGIKNALQFLSEKPKHLEFILGAFCLGPIKELVGENHIKECIDYVINNRIEVAPYYQMDKKKRPSLAVVAQYSEDTQFIGDEGDFQRSLCLPPVEYAQFSILSVGESSVFVSEALKLEDKLWKGLDITNGYESAKIEGIKVREGEPTELLLDKEISEDVLKIGWKALSGTRDSAFLVNTSLEGVTIQLNLQTVGDYSVHRLLATVIRYCLKKQRLWFDQYGLQVATYSQTPPLMTEEGESEFQTVFTISGKMPDSWIIKDLTLPDENANIKIEVVAQPTSYENDEDVEIDGG